MICYNDSCQIYKFNKDNTGWYPRKFRKILNMINKRVTIKLEKKIFKSFINKEFEKKIKKIKKLYKEVKKVVN